jgi:hypothetical protein
MADLNGAWLGTYWQNGTPTRFEATLVQGGNTLSGRILDDSYLGEAQLSGDIAGRSVSFTKRYLTTSVAAIQYSGTVSENEEVMSGTWQIDATHSGRWEARRSGDNLIAELKKQTARPLATAGAGAGRDAEPRRMG